MEGDRQPRKADLLVVDGCIKRIDTIIDRSEHPDIVIDASGMFVLPGFIFSNARLGFSILRGQTDQILDDGERERTALRLVSHLTPDQLFLSAELGICQALHSGITTLFEGGVLRGTDRIVQAAREMKFRLICGRMLADRTAEWPEALRIPLREQLAEGQELARTIAADDCGGLLRYALSTTNPPFCTDECLVQAKALADAGGYPLKIVLTTDRNQLEQLHREGSRQELAALEALDVLGEHTFLVNPSALSELEQNTIRKNGSRVIVNATADLKLGRPLARLPEFIRKGTPVLPGFDSPLYGGRMDALHELSVLTTMFRPQYGTQATSPDQVLSMVTVDAARALGIENTVGTLEPGKRADIVLINPVEDIFAQPATHTNPYCRLVYGASTQDIACTIIDGKIAYQNGHVLGCDEKALVEQANAELVQILEKA